MTANTIAINQNRHYFDPDEDIWLFGYGSLIYKTDFPFLQKRPARIIGWERRFWQGSHDHRGTQEYPGRVVTLIENPGAVCLGMAYRITHEVLEHLDFREKNGYLRFSTALYFEDCDEDRGQALVYIATADNSAFLGEADITDIARHISVSHGPSGANSDYLLKLADSLRDLGASDPHVFAVEKKLRKLHDNN